MFKRKNHSVTIIGEGDSFSGTINTGGRLEVHGTVEGDVAAEGMVSIGPNGAIHGEVTASDLTVSGRVEGWVRVEGMLHVRESGFVQGETSYGSLQVDRGGVIQGRTGAVAARSTVEDVEDSDVEDLAADPSPA